MKKRWIMVLAVGLLVISGVMLLSACKKPVTKKKGTYNYKNEKSEGRAEVGENLKMPANFPSDVPVYKNAKIMATNTNKADTAELIVITLETKDSVQDVKAFYEKELPKNGFDIQNQSESDKHLALSAKKGDMTVIVAVTRNNDKTIVGINVTTKMN